MSASSWTSPRRYVVVTSSPHTQFLSRREPSLVQFDCSNTVAEQVLENISVVLDLSDGVGLPLNHSCEPSAKRPRQG